MEYPADAFAANFPDNIPKINDIIAETINKAPISKIYFISLFCIPTSIILAINRGIITSITTSNITNIGVNIAYFLYSFT